jgi:glutamate N-acetyltransferase/amino-acid N-acetyltransferase
VKTAIHGADPNWGRIVAAAGYSGEPIAPERLRLWVGGGGDALQLVDHGEPRAFDAKAASARMRDDPVSLRLDLGLGNAEAMLWTCDFSAEYVSINADYTT